LPDADSIAGGRNAVLRGRDRQLTPAFVAAAFGISTRHLHSLFKTGAMTIGQYIRSLRVRGCRAARETGNAGHRSLTDLALSWGFYDLSHMTRCFKSEFGMTPSEARARRGEARPMLPQRLKLRKE
jgi:AraC-like DNA-binding protein